VQAKSPTMKCRRIWKELSLFWVILFRRKRRRRNISDIGSCSGIIDRFRICFDVFWNSIVSNSEC